MTAQQSHQLFVQATKLFYQMEFQKGIEQINKCIDAHPDSSMLYSNRALFYSQSGNVDQAAEDLKMAINLNYLNYVAYFNLFSLQLRSGEQEQAFDNLCCSLSCLYLIRGKLKKKQLDLQKSIRYCQNNLQAHILKGLMLMEKGNFKLALNELQWAEDIDTYNSTAKKIKKYVLKQLYPSQIFQQNYQAVHQPKIFKRLECSYSPSQLESSFDQQLKERLSQFNDIYNQLNMQSGTLTQRVPIAGYQNQNSIVSQYHDAANMSQIYQLRRQKVKAQVVQTRNNSNQQQQTSRDGQDLSNSSYQGQKLIIQELVIQKLEDYYQSEKVLRYSQQADYFILDQRKYYQDNQDQVNQQKFQDIERPEEQLSNIQQNLMSEVASALNQQIKATQQNEDNLLIENIQGTKQEQLYQNINQSQHQDQTQLAYKNIKTNQHQILNFHESQVVQFKNITQNQMTLIDQLNSNHSEESNNKSGEQYFNQKLIKKSSDNFLKKINNYQASDKKQYKQQQIENQQLQKVQTQKQYHTQVKTVLKKPLYPITNKYVKFQFKQFHMVRKGRIQKLNELYLIAVYHLSIPKYKMKTTSKKPEGKICKWDQSFPEMNLLENVQSLKLKVFNKGKGIVARDELLGQGQFQVSQTGEITVNLYQQKLLIGHLTFVVQSL